MPGSEPAVVERSEDVVDPERTDDPSSPTTAETRDGVVTSAAEAQPDAVAAGGVDGESADARLICDGVDQRAHQAWRFTQGPFWGVEGDTYRWYLCLHGTGDSGSFSPIFATSTGGEYSIAGGTYSFIDQIDSTHDPSGIETTQRHVFDLVRSGDELDGTVVVDVFEISPTGGWHVRELEPERVPVHAELLHEELADGTRRIVRNTSS